MDAAPFRADGDPQGKWVLEGQPALADPTGPRRGEQASDSSAVCPETGAVAHRAPTGTSTSATGAASLRQLRAAHAGPLIAIGDTGPAHGGDAMREYLATPDRDRRVLRLPAYRPDCNPDAALRAWARAEVPAHTRPGTTARVQERMAHFSTGLAARTAEVQSRCRRQRQALAEAVAAPASASRQEADPVVLTCASV